MREDKLRAFVGAPATTSTSTAPSREEGGLVVRECVKAALLQVSKHRPNCVPTSPSYNQVFQPPQTKPLAKASGRSARHKQLIPALVEVEGKGSGSSKGPSKHKTIIDDLSVLDRYALDEGVKNKYPQDKPVPFETFRKDEPLRKELLGAIQRCSEEHQKPYCLLRNGEGFRLLVENLPQKDWEAAVKALELAVGGEELGKNAKLTSDLAWSWPKHDLPGNQPVPFIFRLMGAFGLKDQMDALDSSKDLLEHQLSRLELRDELTRPLSVIESLMEPKATKNSEQGKGQGTRILKEKKKKRNIAEQILDSINLICKTIRERIEIQKQYAVDTDFFRGNFPPLGEEFVKKWDSLEWNKERATLTKKMIPQICSDVKKLQDDLCQTIDPLKATLTKGEWNKPSFTTPNEENGAFAIILFVMARSGILASSHNEYAATDKALKVLREMKQTDDKIQTLLLGQPKAAIQRHQVYLIDGLERLNTLANLFTKNNLWELEKEFQVLYEFKGKKLIYPEKPRASLAEGYDTSRFECKLMPRSSLECAGKALESYRDQLKEVSSCDVGRGKTQTSLSLMATKAFLTMMAASQLAKAGAAPLSSAVTGTSLSLENQIGTNSTVQHLYPTMYSVDDVWASEIETTLMSSANVTTSTGTDITTTIRPTTKPNKTDNTQATGTGTTSMPVATEIETTLMPVAKVTRSTSPTSDMTLMSSTTKTETDITSTTDLTAGPLGPNKTNKTDSIPANETATTLMPVATEIETASMPPAKVTTTTPLTNDMTSISGTDITSATDLTAGPLGPKQTDSIPATGTGTTPMSVANVATSTSPASEMPLATKTGTDITTTTHPNNIHSSQTTSKCPTTETGTDITSHEPNWRPPNFSGYGPTLEHPTRPMRLFCNEGNGREDRCLRMGELLSVDIQMVKGPMELPVLPEESMPSDLPTLEAPCDWNDVEGMLKRNGNPQNKIRKSDYAIAPILAHGGPYVNNVMMRFVKEYDMYERYQAYDKAHFEKYLEELWRLGYVSFNLCFGLTDQGCNWVKTSVENKALLENGGYRSKGLTDHNNRGHKKVRLRTKALGKCFKTHSEEDCEKACRLWPKESDGVHQGACPDFNLWKDMQQATMTCAKGYTPVCRGFQKVFKSVNVSYCSKNVRNVWIETNNQLLKEFIKVVLSHSFPHVKFGRRWGHVGNATFGDVVNKFDEIAARAPWDINISDPAKSCDIRDEDCFTVRPHGTVYNKTYYDDDCPGDTKQKQDRFDVVSLAPPPGTVYNKTDDDDYPGYTKQEQDRFDVVSLAMRFKVPSCLAFLCPFIVKACETHIASLRQPRH